MMFQNISKKYRRNVKVLGIASLLAITTVVSATLLLANAIPNFVFAQQSSNSTVAKIGPAHKATMPTAPGPVIPQTQESLNELQKAKKIADENVRIQKEKAAKEAEERRIQKEKEEYAQKQMDTAVDVPLCIANSTVKSYMDGAKVTNRLSAQYQLLQTMHINEKGNYETDDGFIGVALGSYYGPIGTKYIVTLDSGVVLKVIKADAKADEHVYNGCNHRQDNSMMEMIIDTQTAANYYGITRGYVLGGNFNNHPDYKGAIVSMKRVTI